MFLLPNTGRCASLALCTALNEYSDHKTEHEPEPRLLYESYLKSRGEPYITDAFRHRMAFFQLKMNQAYGESFRAFNLLEDIYDEAPATKFLLLVRRPVEYVVSAYNKGVMIRGGDEWERYRVHPKVPQYDEMPVYLRLAHYWRLLNAEMLSEISSLPQGRAMVTIVRDDISDSVLAICEFLGVRVRDKQGLMWYLAGRPNRSARLDLPPGFSETEISSRCCDLLEDIQRSSLILV